MATLKGSESGFTLLELVVVVGILLILALGAAPKFRRYLILARQAEAKRALHAIYELEMLHRMNQDVFTAMPLQGRNGAVVNCTSNSLSFGLSPCNDSVFYGYSVTLTAAGFTAIASTGTGVNNRVFLGCAMPDVWTIDQDNQLTHAFDPSSVCN